MRRRGEARCLARSLSSLLRWEPSRSRGDERWICFGHSLHNRGEHPDFALDTNTPLDLAIKKGSAFADIIRSRTICQRAFRN
jgi:hypothetical protein